VESGFAGSFCCRGFDSACYRYDLLCFLVSKGKRGDAVVGTISSVSLRDARWLFWKSRAEKSWGVVS
jgi:hypothetical protein